MMPMFSMLWYASSRFRSCWPMAKATPRTPETTPSARTITPHSSGGVGKQRRHPDQAVDAHLDDDARHDGRHVAGRDRVGAGQPDVQRHDAGLQAEPDERQDEDRRRHPRRQAVLRQAGRARTSRWPHAARRTGRTGTGSPRASPPGRSSRPRGPPASWSSVVTRKKADSAMISQPNRNRMLLRAITSSAMPAVSVP